MSTISLVMMVKNEENRIKVSLDSVKGIVDNFVIMDTGSEDNTISIIKQYCEENKIKLHLLERTFPQPFHYSNARNVVLDFADDKGDYLLLLDCNDELRYGEKLRTFVNEYKGNASAFHVCQEWWNGISVDKYYNNRLIKCKSNWRYRGAIHEYMENPNDKPGLNIRVEGFSLYQDRTLDDDKSLKRFSRDEEVLEKEYSDNIQLIKEGKLSSQDTRTVFYYAQTCICLGKNDKAYRLSMERSELKGFTEEVFHSLYRCGDLSKSLGHSWEESLIWYYKAFEYSANTFDVARIEPLYKIAEYYKDKCPELSYLHLKRCCELSYPTNAILFVDRRIYDYIRWNLLSIVALKIKDLVNGKISCCKAIVAEKREEDIKFLENYIPDKKERDIVVESLKKSSPDTPVIEKPESVVDNTPKTKEQKLKNKMENLRKIRSGGK